MLHCNRLLVFHHRIFSNNDETLANDFNAPQDPLLFLSSCLSSGTCFVPIHLVHKGNEMNGTKQVPVTFRINMMKGIIADLVVLIAPSSK